MKKLKLFFNKLFQFRRLNFTLSFRIIFIYLKRIVGIKPIERDIGYLSYLFVLERCNLQHIAEERNIYKVVSCDGIFLYMRKYPSSDGQVLHQIWIEEEYQVIVDFIIKNFKQDELYILDAGANVGYSSVFLFQRLRKYYKIHFIVVEPSEGNMDVLEKNFILNGISNYQLVRAGLFNKSCYLKIKKDFRDGKEWSYRVEEDINEGNLRAVELREIVTKYQWGLIDFCKIDIEGSEKYLFDDTQYARKLLDLVKLISVEIHEETGLRTRILETFRENHFNYFEHGEITIAYPAENRWGNTYL